MTDNNFAPAIYKKIIEAASEMEPVAKSRRNSQQNYNFRGIDDVVNAISPILSKHGILTVPEVQDMRRETITNAKGSQLNYTVATVKYNFYAEDGSYITATVLGEGMDSGDKSANKAMSSAYKYALFQVFHIPTEETSPYTDSEIDSPEAPIAPPKPEPKENALSPEDKDAVVNAFTDAFGKKPKDDPGMYQAVLLRFGAKTTNDLIREQLPEVFEHIKHLAAEHKH
ncbi:MAG: ERF family protein [Bacillota bacterium]|jgi:hypothetical protein